MAAAETPRCTMVVTGKSYDASCIGHVGDTGELLPFPHETSYEPAKAFERFAAYLKRSAASGEAPVQGKDLLQHLRDTHIELVLIETRIIEMDDITVWKHRLPKKIPSETIYAKIEVALGVVQAASATIESIHTKAQAPQERSTTTVIASGKPSEEPARRDPAERKPLKITTITQGSGAQDSLADKLKEMTKSMGVGPGQSGKGLTEPIVLSARKTGATAVSVNGTLTDDEITERDMEALTSGGTPTAQPTQARIAMPARPEQDTEPLEEFEEAPAIETPAVATPRRPEAKPVTTLSSDDAERLGRSTAALSDDGKLAQRLRQVEQLAVDQAGEVVNDVFLGGLGSGKGVEQTELAQALAEDTQEVSRLGRVIQRTGVSGTGRGGTRPKTARDEKRK